MPVFSLLGDDHVTVFSLLGDVIHQQAENRRFFFVISCSILSFIVLQEFGDSARARKLYEQESDDDDDDEIEPNPKLEQGKFLLDNI